MVGDVSAHLPTDREPLVRVLGTVEVLGRDGVPVPLGGKQAAVLAALALNAGAWVPTHRLVSLVWPDREPPASAGNNLKTYVWQLRRALAGAVAARGGPDDGIRERIESRYGGYRLRLAAGDLDADVFVAEAENAAALLRDGRAAEVAARLPAALALWRGRPYDEIADHCRHSAFGRLVEQYRRSRECLAEAWLELGRPGDAVELLRAVTAEEPTREPAWARLIDALREAGRTGDALAAYQEARRALILELGVEPGPELDAAHQALLCRSRSSRPNAQPAGAGGQASGQTSLSWPAPHQLPRQETVTGRAEELHQLVEAARPGATVPVLAVCGRAGTGKTALAVAAGHALAEEFPDGQVYLDMGARTEPVAVDDALARLIRSVAGPGLWLPDATDERAALWRSVTYGRRLLLLVDDVADAEQLRPLLPATPGCAVLATSRNRLLGLDCTAIVLGAPAESAVAVQGAWVA